MFSVSDNSFAMYRQSTIYKNLQLRAEIIASIRQYFRANDYLEVETPVRIPAPAPEAHIEAQPSGDWYLQPSPELCMKRMLAAGCQRIFQICRCFRQGERGHRHLPELTMLEWYTAGDDYLAMMAQCEGLVFAVVCDLGRDTVLSYQGNRIDLKPPWQRMTVEKAFKTFASMTLEESLRKDVFDEVLALEVEPHLGVAAPLFLYDYPARLGSLARLKPGNPQLAERFELYIAGLEICNAFSELVDPAEQRMRFKQERDLRRKAGRNDYPLPERFLEALKAMPASAGNALGIDRLVMLLADTAVIDDVVAFVPEEL